MRETRWPKATWHGGATTYGPLPDHGAEAIALVLHTTETVGLPSFSNGDTAPHFTYDPRTSTWLQWATLDRYVGTMKGHSSGGHGNCKAIQVEVLAYSSSDVPAGGTWVGDLTDRDYAELADLFRWLISQRWVGDDCTPTPPDGWRYGASSPWRLTDAQWWEFSGVTAHGAVPRNSHWDTGVLNLERVWAEAIQEAGVDTYMVGERYQTYEPIVWDLVLAVGGTINANANSAQVGQWLPWKSDVRLVQVEDFNLLADLLEMNEVTYDKLIGAGLYRYGKEVAALRQLAYVVRAGGDHDA
jgi:hypothetical protein